MHQLFKSKSISTSMSYMNYCSEQWRLTSRKLKSILNYHSRSIGQNKVFRAYWLFMRRLSHLEKMATTCQNCHKPPTSPNQTKLECKKSYLRSKSSNSSQQMSNTRPFRLPSKNTKQHFKWTAWHIFNGVMKRFKIWLAMVALLKKMQVCSLKIAAIQTVAWAHQQK
jgi:hypothetical protein